MTSLRERKKVETRTALSWAAVRLVVERGYDNVRVEDIAEAANVSPRTFNNYFSSKAEAIVFRHRQRMGRAVDELRRQPAEVDLWSAVTAAALATLRPGPEVEDDPVAEPTSWAAGVTAMLSVPVLQAEMLRAGSLIQQDIASAVAERTGTDAEHDLYPQLVAATFGAATQVVTEQAVRGGSPAGIESATREALQLIRAGLPEPGRVR